MLSLIGQRDTQNGMHYINEQFCPFNCLGSTSRPSRKSRVSHWLTRKITSASLRLKLLPGQSMCHLSCRRLLREHADVGRRKRGVPVRNGWLPVLKSSKSWTRSLGRPKGRHQGQRRARRREMAKKPLCPQAGNKVKAIVRTGSTAQKVKKNLQGHLHI